MKSKNLLPILILGQSFMFNGHALAQKAKAAVQSSTTSSVTEDSMKKEFQEVNERWARSLERQFQNAELSTTNRVVGFKKDSGFKAGFDFEYGSIPTLGGGFLSVDRWNVNAGFLPNNGLGFDIQREVTFIKKFNNRHDSLVREPYNPIQRLPLKAEQAMKMDEFEFVGFRVPVTFSASGTTAQSLVTHATAEKFANVRVFSTGEVDVHIYKMPKNHVRVRLFALKDVGFRTSIGVGIIGLNIITRKLIDNPLEFFMQKNKTDLFSIDYIFNLNKKEARDEYDQLLGQKYRISSLGAVKEQILAALPNKSSKNVRDMLYSNLDSIQKLIDDEESKPLEERAVIRLRTAAAETNTIEQGWLASLTKLVRFFAIRKDATTNITMTNVVNDKKDYLIKTITKNYGFDLFTLFGQETKAESGLLVATDKQYNPKQVLGFQTRRFNKDLNFKQKEFLEVSGRMAKFLPEDILAKVKWPDWNTKKDIKNLTIEHILFFNVPVLETIKTISSESVKTELTYLIKNWGKFGARPQDSEEKKYDQEDPRLTAFNRGRYQEAYSWEMDSIPQQLLIALDNRYALETRIGAFDQLQNIPLFTEIGPSLMLRLIPTERLADAVNYRLSISGNDSSDVGGEQSNYPEVTKQEYLNVVASAIAETSYVSDRSFNVRMFINEKGESIGIDQLVREAK